LQARFFSFERTNIRNKSQRSNFVAGNRFASLLSVFILSKVKHARARVTEDTAW